MTAITMSAMLNIVIMFLAVGMAYEVRRWMKVVNAELDNQSKAIESLFNTVDVLADKIILLRKEIK